MEPLEVAVEVFGSDAPIAAEESLEALMTAVHRLDVQLTPDPLTCRLIERLMGDTQRRGAGWIERCAIGDQEGVLAEHRRQMSLIVSALTAGRMALIVVPVRSAATRTGTCSLDRPRRLALPPRLRGLRSGSLASSCPAAAFFQARDPLWLSRTYVSSASTIPPRG